MSQITTVQIADLQVARPPELLVTYALGSCVGICLHDAAAQVGGLAHIMLPSSARSPRENPPERFADTGIALLVQKMEQAGARKARMTAKIAGGAQMFAVLTSASISGIGARNAAAVREVLTALGIPILADDTGADYGRTVYFDPLLGRMRVKSAIAGEKVF